jgi:hypothetical protein
MGAKVDTISLSLSLHLEDVESDCLVPIPIEMVVLWRDSWDEAFVIKKMLTQKGLCIADCDTLMLLYALRK